MFIRSLTALAASVALSPGLIRHHHKGGTRYPVGWNGGNRKTFDPRINRHTGRPHEHKREKARRARQAARAAQ